MIRAPRAGGPGEAIAVRTICACPANLASPGNLASPVNSANPAKMRPKTPKMMAKMRNNMYISICMCIYRCMSVMCIYIWW